MADKYYHIGDTDADLQASLRAGFDFMPVDDTVLKWLKLLVTQ